MKSAMIALAMLKMTMTLTMMTMMVMMRALQLVTMTMMVMRVTIVNTVNTTTSKCVDNPQGKPFLARNQKEAAIAATENPEIVISLGTRLLPRELRLIQHSSRSCRRRYRLEEGK